jgi:hypothetical protein
MTFVLIEFQLLGSSFNETRKFDTQRNLKITL